MADDEKTEKQTQEVDYSLANPDTLTKYKDAASIAHKVLAEITAAATPGTTILSLCQKGDQRLEEETAKVYKGKKISKGIAFPTTVSPNDISTPYTPLKTDTAEAGIELKAGDVIKVQLGAQIDGFPAIVSDTVVVGGEVTPDQADLIIGSHQAAEALLRLLLPPSLHLDNTDEKPYKQPSSHQISQILSKIAAAYGCVAVESTTSWALERNEIEAKKRIVLNPAEGAPKSEGAPEVGDVWGVEISLSKGPSGKLKEVSGKRQTLLRKTDTKTQLKRSSSRATLSEISKKFGTFPFSLRQLDDEKTAKMGVLEAVRGGVLRQFEVLADKDGAINSRIYITAAITKNGIVKLAAPPAPNPESVKSDKKIDDEALLKLLSIPLKVDAKKKRKAAKKSEGGA